MRETKEYISAYMQQKIIELHKIRKYSGFKKRAVQIPISKNQGNN